ncbi:DUF4314 domain-containing protein [Bacillus paranthracis]|uniref:DUF4314 domain-containing protein n=1 Tax=Bacillus paranthracis TaxID=2026186 RepID=UPI00187B0419|nr:DUF4314 domain-containing protein [Bacillus paranthracis]MBE7114637.1 DUF4314 domain-containing protein [Bacillus paranthracis]MBE7154996.1 DUF4314 domain-containing protein [Bacillus paranthracis]
MDVIERDELKRLREKFVDGTRVALSKMDGETIPIGTKGTVRFVDDIGTIHVNWDTGSTLGVAYGVDKVIVIEN